MMSLLEKVAPSRRMRPPRILLLGTEKVGKSTFAADMAKPVFLPVEREEGIDDVNAMAFPVARSYHDAMQATFALIGESHEYKTFVIDSVSTLSPLIIKQAMENQGVETEAKLSGGFGHQYDEPLVLWTSLMRNCDLMRDKGIATVMIGHVKAKRFDDPVNGGYTRYDLDLPEKISQAIYRWVDVILFANWEVFTVKEDAGFSKETSRGVGSGTRKLFTQRRPSHPGGGRGVYGRLPYEMPFNYADFQSAVREQLRIEKEAQGRVAMEVGEPVAEAAVA